MILLLKPLQWRHMRLRSDIWTAYPLPNLPLVITRTKDGFHHDGTAYMSLPAAQRAAEAALVDAVTSLFDNPQPAERNKAA